MLVSPDAFRARLDEAGERRLQALAIAESALNDVLDLLPDALESGMSEADVAELAQVHPLTLDVVRTRRRLEGRLGATF